MKLRLIPALLIAVVALAGCPQTQTPESTARDAIGAAGGFLSAAQTTHLSECQAAPTKSICVAIKKGIEAQRATADGLAIYCAGMPAAGVTPYVQGGACVPIASALSALTAAVSNLNSIVNDVKTLAGAKTTSWMIDLKRMQGYLERQGQ